MINLETRTKLSRDVIVARLKAFFGPGRLGLTLTEETSESLRFEGGGGYVAAAICPEGDDLRLTLVSMEWEDQARQFISRL